MNDYDGTDYTPEMRINHFFDAAMHSMNWLEKLNNNPYNWYLRKEGDFEQETRI